MVKSTYPQEDITLKENNYIKNYDVYYALVDLPELVAGFINLTGYFPQRSLLGNEYIFIRYHFNTNHIRAISIKNRRGYIIIEA